MREGFFDEVVASYSAGNVAIPEVEGDQSWRSSLRFVKYLRSLFGSYYCRRVFPVGRRRGANLNPLSIKKNLLENWFEYNLSIVAHFRSRISRRRKQGSGKLHWVRQNGARMSLESIKNYTAVEHIRSLGRIITPCSRHSADRRQTGTVRPPTLSVLLPVIIRIVESPRTPPLRSFTVSSPYDNSCMITF